MIEQIVAYFQDHGCIVWVLPGRLLIEKAHDCGVLQIGWAIDRLDVKYARDGVLLHQAECILVQLEQACSDNGDVTQERGNP